MPTPQQIATWRFECISFLIDRSIDPACRSARMRAITSIGVVPLGDDTSGSPSKPIPISRSTLYRWVSAYRQKGITGLEPNPKPRQSLLLKQPAVFAWVEYALALLLEQPARSLTQLIAYLKLEFSDYKLGRATLHRLIQRHQVFPAVTKLRTKNRHKKLRGSFEAERPHECWQLDGKGPFLVKFKDGTTRRVHVLSVIDDYSRAVLATVISLSEITMAAVRVTKIAIARYGLPDRFQFDHGSAFDSYAFRAGLAALGIHRNAVKARNPEAQGKIEAYHRSLGRWFVNELDVQEIVNLEHLEQLLHATIDILYNNHHHEVIRTTPQKRLAGTISERLVAPQDLDLAFFAEVRAQSHKKTGSVKLPIGTFRVPLPFAGKRALFRYDIEGTDKAFLLTKDRKEIALEVFRKKPLPQAIVDRGEQRGSGQLQRLLDIWRGGDRPNAEPGFGLPEIFASIGKIVGRRIPEREQEALDVVGFNKRLGPFAREDFKVACDRAALALGAHRPLSVYLEDLERQITKARKRSQDNNKESTS